MSDDMQPRARAALDGLRVDVIPSDRRIVALEAQLLSVCQREAETYCRHDARIEALEAEVADLRARLELHDAIADFVDEQKPLGAEFEAVLAAHSDELYER